MTTIKTAANGTRYRAERAELTRAEYDAGLIPGWNVMGRDHNGSFRVQTVDTREVARYLAREYNARGYSI